MVYFIFFCPRQISSTQNEEDNTVTYEIEDILEVTSANPLYRIVFTITKREGEESLDISDVNVHYCEEGKFRSR